MTKEEGSKIIAEKLAAALALINECESIANETGNSFYFDVEYGMGGRYSGVDKEWNPSSQSC